MTKQKKIFLLGISFLFLTGIHLKAISATENKKPIMIQEQGSFSAGGTVINTKGTYSTSTPLKPDGQTLHGDHAYVSYQIPVNAHKNPLVFLHGAGQSAQTWETTPDGREGFNNIFLRRGFGVYLVDQPRRGRAGRSTVEGTVSNATDDQFWFDTFRIGEYPRYFDNVQFAKGEKALENFFRQMTPNTAAYDEGVISDAMAAIFEKIGNGVLVTHSQGGGPGWWTAIKNSNVKGIIAYEPGSGFVFPEGEVPEPLQTISPFGALSASSISMEEFLKLTKIPIVIYYGDNIAPAPSKEWTKDHWRVRYEMAKLWAEAVNRHGGDVKVVHLPEIGIKGNTHFPFSDLNNITVADEMSKWLKEKGLDK